MPTLISHPVAVLALASFFKWRPHISLLVAGSICTVLLDLDVAAFYLGIPYTHPLGHRGLTHSLAFAVVVGAVATWLYRRLANPDWPNRALFAYFTLATASHGLLDALTNGGRGVGFFIPFNNGRYFMPCRPIRVSPIGASGFFERGWPVLVSEFC